MNGALVAVLAVAGGVWWFTRKKPTPPCDIEPLRLHQWATEHGLTGLYLFDWGSANPPAVDILLETYPSFKEVPTNTLFVVTKSKNFWRYDSDGKVWAAPELRASYCAWRPSEPI